MTTKERLRKQLIIEIEALEKAIENAYFTAQVDDLMKELFRLQYQLERLE